MNFSLPPLVLPHRWSRAKRKRVRHAIRRAQIRAEHWRRVTEMMKTCLDEIWSNAMNRFDWTGCGFGTPPHDRPFVDDAEFLPGGTIVAEFK